MVNCQSQASATDRGARFGFVAATESGWYVLLFVMILAMVILQRLHVNPSLLFFAIESLRVVRTYSKSLVKPSCYLLLREPDRQL